VYGTNEERKPARDELMADSEPMTEDEIGEIMGKPLSELFQFCHKDRRLLRIVLSLAIRNGIAEGQKQSALKMNRAMKTGLYGSNRVEN